jgi:hypothetical protein
MRTPVSVGYLRPRDGVIRATAWRLIDERGDHVELPEFLPNWDYQQDVRIECTLEANLRVVHAESDLPSTASIRAQIQWHATGTGLRGTGPYADLRDGTNTVELQLSGDKLGGVLNLEARVLLGRLGGPPVSVYAAHRPGSILWTNARRTYLEGSGTRFPVTQLSFAESGIAGGRLAAWCLKLESSDLADSAAGSLRVYLNTDNERVRQYLGEPELVAAEQFTRNLRFAVQRQLIALACEHEELDPEGEYEAGSLGELLGMLLRQVFPDRDRDSLRSDLRRDPGEFEAELQARTGYQP